LFSRGEKRTLESPTMTTDLSLDPKETALLLIEYQNEFTTEGGVLYDAVKDCMVATGTLENSKKMLDAAREKGCIVLHIPISFTKVRIFLIAFCLT